MLKMSKSKERLIAVLSAAAVTGSAAFAAVPQIDAGASVLIGGATTSEAAGRTRVDATTGASVMITPDQNYAPDTYPTHNGRHVPDNLNANSPDTARVIIRGERTNFGLNTNTSKNGSAFGANAVAKGDHAAAFGNGAHVKAAEGLAVGYNASVTGAGSVALGGGSLATEANVVSVGSDSLQRRIINVADGRIAAGSHDAVTGNQLYQYGQSLTGGLRKELKSVGAVSAALAGLHPLDYSGDASKFQISAALGTYGGTKAVALGGFYNANPNVLLSFGIASNFGDDHKLAGNIGATFRVGKGDNRGEAHYGDAVISRRLDAMEREVAELKAQNEELKKQIGHK